jgi:hypothetical protein
LRGAVGHRSLFEGEFGINASEGEARKEGRRLKEKGTNAEGRREAVKRRARSSEWRRRERRIGGAVLMVDINNLGCLMRLRMRLCCEISAFEYPFLNDTS